MNFSSSSSVFIISNSVCISTFNYDVYLHFWEGVGGYGLFVLYRYECPLVVFARAYMYALCVSGAVNTQGFVWTF